MRGMHASCHVTHMPIARNACVRSAGVNLNQCRWKFVGVPSSTTCGPKMERPGLRLNGFRPDSCMSSSPRLNHKLAARLRPLTTSQLACHDLKSGSAELGSKL